MIVLAPDGTVDKWEPGYQEVSSFETKFKEYLEMKNRNDKTEDILKELEQPERVSGRKKIIIFFAFFLMGYAFKIINMVI